MPRDPSRDTARLFSGGQTISQFESFALEGGQSLGILEGIGGRRGGVGARGIRSWRRTSDVLDAHLSRRGREPTPLLGETVSQKATERCSLRRPVFTCDLTGGLPEVDLGSGTGYFSSAAGRQNLSINCADRRPPQRAFTLPN